MDEPGMEHPQTPTNTHHPRYSSRALSCDLRHPFETHHAGSRELGTIHFLCFPDFRNGFDWLALR